MNQAILFNDDYIFDELKSAWCFTGLLSGQLITIYLYSEQLKARTNIDNVTKFDLEESVELWLESNEPEGDEIHIRMYS